MNDGGTIPPTHTTPHSSRNSVDNSGSQAGPNLLHAPRESIFGLVGPLMLAKGWSVWPQERDGRRMPSRVDGRVLEWGAFRDRHPSADEMGAFVRDAREANVAVALGPASGNAFCLDIDCMDAAVSARVQEIAFEILGRTPLVRIGRAPKAALIYRYPGDHPPRSRALRFEDRPDCALEILGPGKALTLHGLHHATGRWFAWPDTDPINDGPEAAPEVHPDRLRDFLAEVGREFPFEAKRSAATTAPRPGTARLAVSDEGIAMPSRVAGERLTDGREAFLRDLAWEAVRLNGHTLLRAHGAGGLDEAVERIVGAVIMRFEEECEMSGKWTDGLPQAAQARVGSAVLKLVSGEMNPAPEQTAASSPTGRLARKEFDTARFRELPPPRQYALPGLPVGKVGLLVSAGGTGKSTLALGLAASIVTGRNPWNLLPDDPPRGKVIYVSVEDDAERIWQQMRDLDASAGGAVLSMPDFEHMFRLFALDDEGFSIGSWRPGVGIAPSDDMLELAAVIREARPALVILDTLNRALGGLPENDNNAMAGAVGTLERAVKPGGGACLVLHHTSKGAALGGLGDLQQAARGAGAIVDNARWVSNLTGMTADEAGDLGVSEEDRWAWVRWTNSKANGVRPFEAKWLHRGDGGVLSARHPPRSPSTPAHRGAAPARATCAGMQDEFGPPGRRRRDRDNG